MYVVVLLVLCLFTSVHSSASSGARARRSVRHPLYKDGLYPDVPYNNYRYGPPLQYQLQSPYWGMRGQSNYATNPWRQWTRQNSDYYMYLAMQQSRYGSRNGYGGLYGAYGGGLSGGLFGGGHSTSDNPDLYTGYYTSGIDWDDADAGWGHALGSLDLHADGVFDAIDPTNGMQYLAKYQPEAFQKFQQRGNNYWKFAGYNLFNN